MAKAFQCDICNRFYTYTNHQIYKICDDEHYSIPHRLDICDDCYLKLLRFINREEEAGK